MQLRQCRTIQFRLRTLFFGIDEEGGHSLVIMAIEMVFDTCNIFLVRYAACTGCLRITLPFFPTHRQTRTVGPNSWYLEGDSGWQCNSGTHCKEMKSIICIETPSGIDKETSRGDFPYSPSFSFKSREVDS
jgi:hypothetical protein